MTFFKKMDPRFLVFGVLLTNVIAGGASAGWADKDPKTLDLQKKFLRARVPTINDFKQNQIWNCTYHNAGQDSTRDESGLPADRLAFDWVKGNNGQLVILEKSQSPNGTVVSSFADIPSTKPFDDQFGGMLAGMRAIRYLPSEDALIVEFVSAYSAKPDGGILKPALFTGNGWQGFYHNYAWYYGSCKR